MTVIQKKVCMLGSFAVGKTSLVRRFVDGRFDDKYLSTIGVKISRMSLSVEDITANLIIWDLAGGDEFLRSNAGYLRGAVGALIVCDLTRPQTLRAASEYYEQIRTVNPSASIVLAANKADLTDEREISDEDLEDLSTTMSNSSYYFTSAKSGLNVVNAFNELATQIIGQ